MSVPTHFIKRKAGASLLHSARTAAAIGRPLNWFVTVSLWHLGIGPDTASRFFQELRERRFQRWSMYRPRRSTGPRNGAPTYAWVIEAPDACAHVHWMVHVQPGQEAAFTEALDRWIARYFGLHTVPNGVVQVAPINNAEGLKKYLAKGLDPHLARLWRIIPTDCGLVHGRRAGTSRNIGPSEWQPRKAAYLEARRRRAA